MKFSITATFAIVALACSARAAPASHASAQEAASQTKWVGLCVKVLAPGNRISEALVAISSGDHSLDKRMQAYVIGTSTPGHPPLDKWVPMRVADDDRDHTGARAADAPPLPELDCEKLEQAPR